jgi:hypothetical protein
VDTIRRRSLNIAGVVLVAAVLVVAVLLVRGWRPWHHDVAAVSTVKGASGSVAMPVNPQMESEFGIRFTAVGVTSGGGMIMLRYQILDSDKVLSVHDTQTAPYVLGADGFKFDAPGMQGHSHIGKKKLAGTTDYILLANSGGRLKPGMVVTIVAGSLRMSDVVVV